MARQYPVLIINPNPDEHKRLEKSLEEHFQVLHVARPEMATVVFGSIRPWAVISSFKQDSSMNGPKISLHLRNRPGGQGCIFIVHGIPEGGKVPRDVDGFTSTWKLDLFLPSGRLKVATITRYLTERLDKLNVPPDLDALSALNFLPDAAPSNPLFMSEDPESESGDVSEDDDEPEPEVEPTPELPDDLTKLTWSELAKLGLRTETLRAMLTKDIWIHGRVDAEHLEGMTWSELFVQEWSGDIVKAIFTKPIGRKKSINVVHVPTPDEEVEPPE